MKPIIFVSFDTIPSPEDLSHIINGMRKDNPDFSFIVTYPGMNFACLVPENYKIQAVEFACPKIIHTDGYIKRNDKDKSWFLK